MTLTDLIYRTRLYTRDNNSYMFTDGMITLFLNEAIDRVRQYPHFTQMSYLNFASDEPKFIPVQYHYMLALFASARCFEHDERFYEAADRRNEFEQLLGDFINEVQSGNIPILDEEGNEIDDVTHTVDYVTDDYYKPKSKIKIVEVEEDDDTVL